MSGRAAALAALGLLLVGASPAGLTVPPYEGVYEPRGTDERGLWMLADEDERIVRDSPLLIQDAGLNDYVRSVLCTTVGEERCRNVRVYLMRVPAFNASMSPNGMMIVWSGLLLRCRNEAELASVLGHEFAHFERRHSLRGFQRRRTATDVLAWSALLSAIAAQPDMTRLFTIGAYYQFNRDQEREADLLGLAYLTRSQYRPQAAADIWVRSMAEVDASAVGRSQRQARYDRTPFFSTHPTNAERAGYLRRLAGEETAQRVDNDRAYQAALGPWLPAFLDDQIRRNDFGGTEYILAQLAEGSGWTAPLLHARGELYRMRGNPRDLVNAADFYRQSLALDDSRAEAARGLGLALMRARQVEEGKAALRRYLSLAPDAPDVAMIGALLDQSM